MYEHIESEVDYLFKATCNDISIVLGAITSLLSRVLKEPVEKEDKSDSTMARTHAMQNNILRYQIFLTILGIIAFVDNY